MNISKKQWVMIAVGVGALLAIYWFFFRKKKAESGYDENVMIFGNENGYTANQLDPNGIESGYLKKCPQGQTFTGECTMIIDPNTSGGATIHKYRCCEPAAETGRTGSVMPKFTKKPAGSARTKECFNSKGVKIPCPTTLPEEDIIRTSTFG